MGYDENGAALLKGPALKNVRFHLNISKDSFDRLEFAYYSIKQRISLLFLRRMVLKHSAWGNVTIDSAIRNKCLTKIFRNRMNRPVSRTARAKKQQRRRQQQPQRQQAKCKQNNSEIKAKKERGRRRKDCSSTIYFSVNLVNGQRDDTHICVVFSC